MKARYLIAVCLLWAPWSAQAVSLAELDAAMSVEGKVADTAVPAAPNAAATLPAADSGSESPGEVKENVSKPDNASLVPEVPELPNLAITPKRKPITLFMTPEEMDSLAQAKAEFLAQSMGDEELYSEEDLLDQLQGLKLNGRKKQAVQETHYRQYYMETYIYRAPNDWILWLQDNEQSKKFVPTDVAEPNARLKIIAVEKESVTFEWRPTNWGYIQTTFKDDEPDIELDPTRQTVTFTLRINQTLYSYEMAIKEGKMPLVAIPTPESEAEKNALPPTPQDGKTPPNPAATSTPASPTEKERPGLFDAYHNLDNIDMKKP